MSTVQRFVEAQDRDGVFERALAELRAGHKTTHWMWFVFPQLAGLGRSAMSQRYALASVDEAREYLADPVLRERMAQCTTVLLELPADLTAEAVFGGALDAAKLRSSMTLFAAAAPQDPSFRRVLGRWFRGEPDPATAELLDPA